MPSARTDVFASQTRRWTSSSLWIPLRAFFGATPQSFLSRVWGSQVTRPPLENKMFRQKRKQTVCLLVSRSLPSSNLIHVCKLLVSPQMAITSTNCVDVEYGGMGEVSSPAWRGYRECYWILGGRNIRKVALGDVGS